MAKYERLAGWLGAFSVGEKVRGWRNFSRAGRAVTFRRSELISSKPCRISRASPLNQDQTQWPPRQSRSSPRGSNIWKEPMTLEGDEYILRMRMLTDLETACFQGGRSILQARMMPAGESKRPSYPSVDNNTVHTLYVSNSNKSQVSKLS